MKFSSLVQSIVATFEMTSRVPIYIEGAPGGGKSAAAKEVGRIMGFDRIIPFFASLRDPVDLLGTPRNDGTVTRWIPPEELYSLSTGRNLFIVEELSDAPTPMQNGLCGLMWDRFLNNLHLSDQTCIIATGNRTKDKSGANRIVTKLAGRVRRITFTESLDDFAKWWQSKGYDPVTLQYLRYCPEQFSAFDPNMDSSPTPRNWEFINFVPTTLPTLDYMESCAGHVGEGAAAGYVAFRDIWQSLPDLAMAILHPDSTPIPTRADIKYATLGALATRVDMNTFANATKYADRFPPDLSVMFMQDVMLRLPAVKSTPTFIAYAVKHQDVMF